MKYRDISSLAPGGFLLSGGLSAKVSRHLFSFVLVAGKKELDEIGKSASARLGNSFLFLFFWFWAVWSWKSFGL